MTALSAGLSAALFVAAVLPSRTGLRRLGGEPQALGLLGRRRTRASPVVPARRSHRVAASLVAVALVVALGVPWGLPPAVVALVVVPRLLARIEPAEIRRRREQTVADLPLAVDLLAACLRAGSPPVDALAVVAVAIGGPLGELLTEVEQRLRLGADPADAWQLVAAEPGTAPLGRAAVRAARSGSPLAQTLEHLATDVRQRRRWTADERARAVETRAVVPLGLCFLPAFVLIGIVPTIAGSLSGLVGVFGP
jgi:Flp pilus assembly protein TadB